MRQICNLDNSVRFRAEAQIKGKVSEWLKEHAWKVCVPLKGTEGSNPFFSAKKIYAGVAK